MLRVALTGGIGTGKTAVLQCWRGHGVSVIDADAVAHAVVAAGTPASQAIASRFGASVMTASGDVDRARLAAVVFHDDDARRDLEHIVHPAVYAAITSWMNGCADRGERLAVAEIPLVYETGHQGEFDRVVVTACDETEQVRRVMLRGGTEADARRRMAAQWPLARKAALADFVIRTDGSFDETHARAEAVLRELRCIASGPEGA